MRRGGNRKQQSQKRSPERPIMSKKETKRSRSSATLDSAPRTIIASPVTPVPRTRSLKFVTHPITDAAEIEAPNSPPDSTTTSTDSRQTATATTTATSTTSTTTAGPTPGLPQVEKSTDGNDTEGVESDGEDPTSVERVVTPSIDPSDYQQSNSASGSTAAVAPLCLETTTVVPKQNLTFYEEMSLSQDFSYPIPDGEHSSRYSMYGGISHVASGWFSSVGNRTDQDDAVVCGKFVGRKSLPSMLVYNAIFDGHYGNDCSRFLGGTLHNVLETHYAQARREWRARHILASQHIDTDHTQETMPHPSLDNLDASDKPHSNTATTEGGTMTCGINSPSNANHTGDIHPEDTAQIEEEETVNEMTNSQEQVEQQIHEWEDMIKTILLKSFAEVEAKYLGKAGKCCGCQSGSTALLVLTQMHMGRMTLYIANLGDCRAVLCRGEVAEQLTEDHKPQRQDEAKRIKEAGGSLYRDGQGTLRVQRGGICRSFLAVTRAIGDYEFKVPKQVISPIPDVSCVHLQPDDSFVVIASDGIWDILTNQEAINVAKQYTDPYEASTNVVQAAIDKNPGASTENMSVIVVRFEANTPTPAPTTSTSTSSTSTSSTTTTNKTNTE
ncbi:protein serine/threonine phosphatase 2C family protein [Pelomyxa schiedti]|nr:protein serine/threonine phosphatase 2C family protein [Pelomyxa schiedti]